MNMIIDTTARTAQTIAAEIRMLDHQAASVCMSYIIEIGKRLVEAKAMVEEGKWLEYIKTELNYEKSTAQNYMRLYEEYGTGQTSLFGSFTETETFKRLTYTQALALLQVPREDREDFARENDIEHMSTRELQKAIRERDAAISEKNAAIVTKNAAIEAREESEREADRLRDAAKVRESKVEQLEQEAKDAARKLKTGEMEIEKLREQVRDAQKNEADAKIALKKAQENPEIPENIMAQIRAEAEAKATEKATKEAEVKLADAVKENESIRAKLQLAEHQVESARKELQLQNPEAAVFKTVFEQVQQDFDRLNGTLKNLRLSAPELGTKLTRATIALLEKLKSDVAEDGGDSGA